MPWLYRVVQFFLIPFIGIYNRTGISGKENIPRSGPFILAANHSSYWDILLLCASIWRPLHYLAKSELFKTRLANFFFTSVGQIKIERGKGDPEALTNAIEALNSGKIVVFFPEGTTIGGEKLGRGHTGVARVALKAGVPVVPAGLMNTWRIWPRGSKFPKPLKARIAFGKPMRFDKYHDSADDWEVTRMITDRIMGKIAGLIGTKYEPE